ncbi:hypothetical protein F5883DRAFT_536961 [Diaporthe sp. PMI_573]|nr:hypothetical protein F5883DRAFT_536961 [Diaporthaceae sp. PMI_573]
MDKAIQETEFLRFAMSNFGAGTPQDRTKEEKTCRLMHDSLTERLGGQPTFARLTESDMLLKSVWSQDTFRLYYPITWRSGSESPEWSFLSDDGQELVEVKSNLIVWDTAEHNNIMDAVGASHGIFKGRLEGVNEEEVEYSLLFRAPSVMRVGVLCNGRTDGLTRPQISQIRLPGTQASTKRIGIKKAALAVQETTFDMGPHVHVYRLLAIVRLRARGSEQDDIQFFDLRGDGISPMNMRQPGLQRYMGNNWSIEDQDRSFMLYYERTGIEPAGSPYPDVMNEHPVARRSPSATGTPGPNVSGSGGGDPADGTVPQDVVVEEGGAGAGADDTAVRPQRAGPTSIAPGEQSQQLASTPVEEQPGRLTDNILPPRHTNSPESTVTPRQKGPAPTIEGISLAGQTSSPDISGSSAP